MKPSNLVIIDFETTRQVLASNTFIRVDISEHLDNVKKHTGLEFPFLTKYSSGILPFLDGEPHYRIKKHLTKYLSKRSLLRKNNIIKKISDEALEGLKAADSPDLVDNYTDELALNIIDYFLGVQISNRDEFIEMLSIATLIVEPLSSINTLKKMEDAYEKLTTILIDSYKNCAPDTLFYELQQENEPHLSYDDIITLMVSLTVGVHTISELVSNFLVAFSDIDATYKSKFRDEEWVQNHINHIIRLFASTEYLGRQANNDITLKGCPINKMDRVYMHIPQANRDTKYFRNKNDLQSIDGMKPLKHMSFGAGSHVCPGNYLTELILIELIPSLAKSIEAFTIDKDNIKYQSTTVAKRLKKLPLTKINFT